VAFLAKQQASVSHVSYISLVTYSCNSSARVKFATPQVLCCIIVHVTNTLQWSSVVTHQLSLWSGLRASRTAGSAGPSAAQSPLPGSRCHWLDPTRVALQCVDECQ
jgi:hypothetical protein